MSDADIDDTDLLALPPAVEALLFNDILRRDFVAFCEMVFATVAPGIQYEPNWHIEAMAGAAAEVRSGKHPRLIVNCPPRALKSIIFSVALPAFMLGHDPTHNLLLEAVNHKREPMETFMGPEPKLVIRNLYGKGVAGRRRVLVSFRHAPCPSDDRRSSRGAGILSHTSVSARILRRPFRGERHAEKHSSRLDLRRWCFGFRQRSRSGAIHSRLRRKGDCKEAARRSADQFHEKVREGCRRECL